MGTSFALAPPRLATESEAEQVFALLCSARDEIKLAECVCDPAHYSEYLATWREYCATECVWTISDGAKSHGMLVLKPALWGALEIRYVVVAKSERGKGVGSALVRHVQSLDGVTELRTEARNEKSKRMLERCGFAANREINGGYPILTWRHNK